MNWISAGAVSGFLAVALGAFGAHALRTILSESGRATYQTASAYHLAHSVALVLLGALVRQSGGLRLLELSGWAFAGGILLFSGSLYLLSLTGLRWLGAVTPLGGLLLLAGWACLALGASRG